MTRARTKRLGLIVIVSAASVLVLGNAAAGPAAQLHYERGRGAESCPDEEVLRGLISARLGYDPIQPSAPLHITASIARSGNRLRGRVEVRDADGTGRGAREMSAASDDCVELASSMALAISIAIDPLSLSRPPPPPSATPPPPAVDAAPVVEAAPADTTPSHPEPPHHAVPASAAPPDPIHFHAGVGVVTSLGAASAPAVGAILFGGTRWRALSVDIEGRADAPAGTAAPHGEVSSSLLLAALVPCLHFGPGFGCALAYAGRMHAEGSGVDVSREDSTLYVAAGARVGVELRFFAPLGARFHGDLLAIPKRVTLSLNEQGVWSTPPLSGALGADLVLRFQ